MTVNQARNHRFSCPIQNHIPFELFPADTSDFSIFKLETAIFNDLICTGNDSYMIYHCFHAIPFPVSASLLSPDTISSHS